LLPGRIIVRDFVPGNCAGIAKEFIDLLRAFGNLLDVIYGFLGFCFCGRFGRFLRGFLLGYFFIESAEQVID
jgi:hypothetical protein